MLTRIREVTGWRAFDGFLNGSYLGVTSSSHFIVTPWTDWLRLLISLCRSIRLTSPKFVQSTKSLKQENIDGRAYDWPGNCPAAEQPIGIAFVQSLKETATIGLQLLVIGEFIHKPVRCSRLTPKTRHCCKYSEMPDQNWFTWFSQTISTT